MLSPSRGIVPLVHPPVFQKGNEEKIGTGASQDRYFTSRLGASPRFFTTGNSREQKPQPPFGTESPVPQKSDSGIFEPPRAAVKLVALESRNISSHPNEGCRRAESAMPKTRSGSPAGPPSASFQPERSFPKVVFLVFCTPTGRSQKSHLDSCDWSSVSSAPYYRGCGPGTNS